MLPIVQLNRAEPAPAGRAAQGLPATSILVRDVEPPRPSATGAGGRPQPDDDDTVRLDLPRKKQPLVTTRRAWFAAAGLVGAGCLAGGVRLYLTPAPAPPPAVAPPAPTPVIAQPPPLAPTPVREFVIRAATEAEILHHTGGTGMTVFRFAGDHRVLVLDFPTLVQQGMMLDRVAALIEKAGAPRNRVLTEDELLTTIRAGGDTVATYYYGHDYSAGSLQRFFDLVDREEIALEPDEQILRRLLRQEGWLEPGVHRGLISIPAVGSNADITLSARRTILHHELSHGVFFSDPDYASFVQRFWDTTLTGQERSAVRRFLGSEGYDMAYEELMYNEMQAYLMFTHDPEFFRPDFVAMSPEHLSELQDEFLRGMPKGWLHDALAATPIDVRPAAPGNPLQRARSVHRIQPT